MPYHLVSAHDFTRPQRPLCETASLTGRAIAWQHSSRHQDQYRSCRADLHHRCSSTRISRARICQLIACSKSSDSAKALASVSKYREQASNQHTDTLNRLRLRVKLTGGFGLDAEHPGDLPHYPSESNDVSLSASRLKSRDRRRTVDHGPPKIAVGIPMRPWVKTPLNVR